MSAHVQQLAQEAAQTLPWGINTRIARQLKISEQTVGRVLGGRTKRPTAKSIAILNEAKRLMEAQKAELTALTPTA
jgi:hypothetical protein